MNPKNLMADIMVRLETEHKALSKKAGTEDWKRQKASEAWESRVINIDGKEFLIEVIEIKDREDDYLLFKWGTLKGWSLNTQKGKDLLKRYFEIGSSESAIMQHDSDEQKKLICQMIDECRGTLQSDWTGEMFTKEKAKDYVMNYGIEK